MNLQWILDIVFGFIIWRQHSLALDTGESESNSAMAMRSYDFSKGLFIIMSTCFSTFSALGLHLADPLVWGLRLCCTLHLVSVTTLPTGCNNRSSSHEYPIIFVTLYIRTKHCRSWMMGNIQGHSSCYVCCKGDYWIALLQHDTNFSLQNTHPRGLSGTICVLYVHVRLSSIYCGPSYYDSYVLNLHLVDRLSS
mgnify:CR=1 FL=1